MVIIFDKGKPISASTSDEAKEMSVRAQAIDKALKEFGYKDGYENYSKNVEDLAKNRFDDYMKFLGRVDQIADELKKLPRK